MTSLLFTFAIIAALVAVGIRRYRARRARVAADDRPGATVENAIYIRTFDEMDDELRRRWCSCGGFLDLEGEGSRESAGRRFRVARMRCLECEAATLVFFDTTDLLQ